MASKNVESERSKSSSKSSPFQLFSSREDRWTSEQDKRYTELGEQYRTGPDEMDPDQVRELLQLQMRKETLRNEQTEARFADLEAKMKSTRSKKSPKEKKKKGSPTKRRSRRDQTPTSSSSDSENTSTEDGSSTADTAEETSEDENLEEVEVGAQSKKKKKKKPRMPEMSPDTRAQVEGVIGDLVSKRFYSLLDEDRAPTNHSFVRAPAVGRHRHLSEALEKRLRSDTKGMFYADRTSKSHDLNHLLTTIRSYARKGKLTSDATINLLLRFLQGQAFNLTKNLMRANQNSALIFESLQKTFRDQMDSYAANKALDRFLDQPDLISLTKVSSRIFELSSIVFQDEPETTRAQSISVTASTSFMNFVTRYYPRHESGIVRQTYAKFKSRRKNEKNPIASYFDLTSIANQQLDGILPSYARNLPPRASGQRVDPPRPRPPYQQVSRLDLPEDDFEFDLKSNLSLEDRDAIDRFSDFDTESVLAAEQVSAPNQYRCLLCGQQKHASGANGLFRVCDVFPNMLPIKVRQGCCGNRHPVLPPGKMCPSPLAKDRTRREPVAEQQHRRDQDRNKVQIYS